MGNDPIFKKGHGDSRYPTWLALVNGHMDYNRRCNSWCLNVDPFPISCKSQVQIFDPRPDVSRWLRTSRQASPASTDFAAAWSSQRSPQAGCSERSAVGAASRGLSIFVF